MKYYAREGFIFVLQDVRGRNSSEGEFVQVRPLNSDGVNSSKPDESTDAWDTIGWLVRHVANNNGRVGMSGISYPGFYAACGAINSHPALKAVSPQAPIGDWFMGDDYHRNGALYLSKAFNSSLNQMLARPTRETPARFKFGTRDGYQFFLGLGQLASADSRAGFWQDIVTHGTYDEFWQARNPRPHLTNIHAAILMVGGWYDAEDLFGALEVYRVIEKQNPGI
jgi:putative CocE/NonD family hydrolase